MFKKGVVAETGAGQHGADTATVCGLLVYTGLYIMAILFTLSFNMIINN